MSAVIFKNTIYKPRVLSELPSDIKEISVNIHREDLYGVTKRKFKEFYQIESLQVEAPPLDILYILESLNSKTLKNLIFNFPSDKNDKVDKELISKIIQQIERLNQIETLQLTSFYADDLKHLNSLKRFISSYLTINSETLIFLLKQKKLEKIDLTFEKYIIVDWKLLTLLPNLKSLVLRCSTKKLLSEIRKEFIKLNLLIPIEIEGPFLFSEKSWGEGSFMGIYDRVVTPILRVEIKEEDYIELFSKEGSLLFKGSGDEILLHINNSKILDLWLEKKARVKIYTYKSNEKYHLELIKI